MCVTLLVLGLKKLLVPQRIIRAKVLHFEMLLIMESKSLTV